MIQYVTGDLTNVDIGFIVHGVNCQGVMRSGVAWAIRQKWPHVFDEYSKAFENGNKPKLGGIQYVQIKPALYVVNAFTQEWYGRDGKQYVSYEAIKKCFEQVVERQSDTKLFLPISFPRIGAGLGGGDWTVIEKILNETLRHGGICYSMDKN
jgi:O-acetyl-ADP-ribose deacetylase (regulator of RNase III)